jgi:hypothetical protein
VGNRTNGEQVCDERHQQLHHKIGPRHCPSTAVSTAHCLLSLLPLIPEVFYCLPLNYTSRLVHAPSRRVL